MRLQVEKDTDSARGLARDLRWPMCYLKSSSAMRGEEKGLITLMIDIHKLHDIKREHFSSAEEYITNYQRQISVLRRVKLAPLPFYAIAIMLREVEEELPGIAFIKEALQKVANP